MVSIDYCILTMEIMEIYHKCSSDNIPKYGNDIKISQFIIYRQLNIIYTSFILISYIYIIIRVNGPGTRVDMVWN
jgi:hypothetical protein